LLQVVVSVLKVLEPHLDDMLAFGAYRAESERHTACRRFTA
jgi:hypothetical protein